MSSWIKHTMPRKRHFISNPDSTNSIITSSIFDNIHSKVCLLPHFGLGDLICMIPVIQYLTTLYDEVKVVCLEKNINNIKTLFKDNKKVMFLIHNRLNPINIYNNEPIIEGYNDIYPFNEEKYKDELVGYNILRVGIHKYFFEKNNKIKLTDDYIHNCPPFNYYKQLNIPYSIFWNNIHMPNLEIDSLTNILKENEINNYVFIHNTVSNVHGELFTKELLFNKFSLNSEKVLFINSNINMYSKDSSYYNIAEYFINRPILDYKNILINADYLFLTNSSFFCFCLHLPIKTSNMYAFERNRYSLDYIYDKKYGFKNDRSMFHILNITGDIVYKPTFILQTDMYMLESTKNEIIVKENEIKPISYISGGKLGDFIFQLGIIHSNYIKTGKKGILYIADIGDKFLKGMDIAYEDTKDIILKQEYIQDYKLYNNEHYDVNLSLWRTSEVFLKCNWIELFKHQYSVNWGLFPWINHINIREEFNNKIVVAYSLIRQNTNIDLGSFFKKFNRDLFIFVCFDINEYIEFCKLTSTEYDYIVCKNINEMLEYIYNSKLFISNFSSPLTLAISLHKKIIAIMPSEKPYIDTDIILVNNINKTIPNIYFINNEINLTESIPLVLS
jgi:hypothetical protein